MSQAYVNFCAFCEAEFEGRLLDTACSTCRDSDTQPKSGDVEQAPLVSGAGRQASPKPDAPTPNQDQHKEVE